MLTTAAGALGSNSATNTLSTVTGVATLTPSLTPMVKLSVSISGLCTAARRAANDGA